MDFLQYLLYISASFAQGFHFFFSSKLSPSWVEEHLLTQRYTERELIYYQG